MSWTKDLGTMVPVVVGACAALSGPWLADIRQSRARRRNEWSSFQRQTLIDLQDACVETHRLGMYLSIAKEVQHLATDEESQNSHALQIKRAFEEYTKVRMLIARLDNRDLAHATKRVMHGIMGG